MKPESTDTKGLAELRRLMGENHLTVADVSERIPEVGLERMRTIIQGKDNPSYALAKIISKAMEYPAGLWMEDYPGDVVKEFPIPDGRVPGPGRGHTREKMLAEGKASCRRTWRGCKRMLDDRQRATSSRKGDIRGERKPVSENARKGKQTRSD